MCSLTAHKVGEIHIISVSGLQTRWCEWKDLCCHFG